MDETKLTPMMAQYLALKENLQDEILFFRLGDFYEMFLEDAKIASSILNLTLTARNGMPMCGIPYHAATNYIKRLLDAGQKVAICEQTEMPTGGKTIAKREIVQIITPGTVVEDEFLDSLSNNYLLSISLLKEGVAIAYSELSSGLFRLQLLPRETRFDSLRALIEELHPREILVNEENYFNDTTFRALIDNLNTMVTRLPLWYFSIKEGFNRLRSHLETHSLKQFGFQEGDGELSAGGALLYYLQESSQSSLSQITTFEKVERGRYLLIDEATRRNLELVRNLHDNSTKGTLFSAINQTVSSGGARLLNRWIATPLSRLEEILERQGWVTWFLDNPSERSRIRSLLSKSRDVSRLSSRVAMRRATPQDLMAIAISISILRELQEEHSETYLKFIKGYLKEEERRALAELEEKIKAALKEEVSGLYTPGKVIKKGYNGELDRLRSLTLEGSSKLEEYVERLKDENSIPTIKLGDNKIIGYYLEIPKTHTSKVPQWFYRKQTLVNAERYTTEELVALEGEINSASELCDTLERSLFEEVLTLTATFTAPLLAMGELFNTLDVLQSFAHGAHLFNYTKPEMVEGDFLEIEEGRHPVVEQFLPLGKFVANPLKIGEDGERFCLITGPNMAGKSTFLRQNALIVLMGHLGAYVPATRAKIGLIDKLFCRVGSSDNIARGESTFLIEMQETAFILQTATKRSLAIMDEIGRGTSTQDGMSLAYAIMESLIEKGVKTLFATHYHELTMLDTSNIQLLTLAVAETNRKIVFLKRVKEGVADSSYGLHVAKMAGIPTDVIKRAALFQKHHFADYTFNGNQGQLDLFTDLFETPSNPLAEQLIARLNNFSTEESTPLQALNLVEELKGIVEELQ
ncbi:MAG: DNA mismatch repair protein MutS [Sphaerochaetaceae bacterium]|jgi:DNA mismatch repair protein MutS|nr:DNA mismatch repair protein MutS [Sphaerochaetaceae bacterium]HHU88420.1 DNA mismatch repair protein MutS [Spirochaetales bacterium]